MILQKKLQNQIIFNNKVNFDIFININCIRIDLQINLKSQLISKLPSNPQLKFILNLTQQGLLQIRHFMNTYQQFNNFIQPSSSKKYIDPQKIFPKRLGTYQGGNALVLQYYNLQSDKFKKHVIPLDHSRSVKQNLQGIYKNPKHAMLLRRVQPKYIESAIKGENSNYQSNRGSDEISSRERSNMEFTSNSQTQYMESSNQQNSNTGSSYVPSSRNQHSGSSQNPTSSYLTSENNQVSSIINPQSSSVSKQQIEQIDQEYYEEEFQDFEISQSQGKKNNLPSYGLKSNNSKQADLSLNSNKGDASNKDTDKSITMPLQSKYNKQEEQQVQQKPKKAKKSKKKKAAKQQQQDAFQFDFLDDDQNPKPKKEDKPKKQTKSKSKEKSKDKTKKDETPKNPKSDTKKQQKPTSSKPVKQEIQQDFQFL